MISITAESRKAERDLARLERALATAKPRALKLAAGIVKRQEIAAMKKDGSAITGKFPPLTEIHTLLHGAKSGGVLVTSSFWRITSPELDSVEVDVVDRLQPLAQRWQTGEWPGVYPVAEYPRAMHVQLGRRGIQIPHVPPFSQPERNVRDPVAENAGANLAHWYLSCLKKVADRAVVAFQKTREKKTGGRARSRSRSSGGVRDYARAKGRH